MVTARGPAVLLEREQEIARLSRAWQEARVGSGSLWFICAEAGGGKSRLASELLRRCDGRTLRGAAEPVSPPEPYLAVCHALPAFEPAATREESISRAIEALSAAADGGPLLCFFDDLHFADEGTAALIVRLARACRSRPWLIVAAFRPGEGTAMLQQAAIELVAQGMVTRIDLPQLSRAAVTALVEAMRGQPVAPDDADALYRDSGGNPWFVETLARGSGAISLARDRILLRLDRLESATPGACAVLAALSPATRLLPHAVAAEVCGGDSPSLRRTLLSLRNAGVLLEENSEHGGWGFRHELLRRAVLTGMIAADRAEVHRALAEALQAREAGAAELAMLFDAAGDQRTLVWAERAAREASAIDAHAEALGQYERALRFARDPDVRRAMLLPAALEAFQLGRFAVAQQLTEAALAIPGGEPEALSLLHQRAANAARFQGDLRAAAAHMDLAEQLLIERTVSYQKANVAVARLLQHVVQVQPELANAAIARTLALATELAPIEPDNAAIVAIEVRFYQVLALIDRGDPAAFALFAELMAASDPNGPFASDLVIATINTYVGAVGALFHDDAERLRQGLLAGMARHRLDWMQWADSHRVLELVQRGRYEAARALATTLPDPAPGSVEYSALQCALVLREARTGSPERARTLLAAVDDVPTFRHRSLMALVGLEIALLERERDLAERAASVYAMAERRQYARVAGAAAVAMAHAGAAPPAMPDWLALHAPLRVFWAWSTAIAAHDQAGLRDVSQQLTALDLPYEAALALRDAGDLNGAYRALGVLGAGEARRQTALAMRAGAQPIPRRTRAAIARDGLTTVEREVCRLVAAGAKSKEIADQLVISVRTVDGHLNRIYQKSGASGRVALAVWWREQQARED